MFCAVANGIFHHGDSLFLIDYCLTPYIWIGLFPLSMPVGSCGPLREVRVVLDPTCST